MNRLADFAMLTFFAIGVAGCGAPPPPTLAEKYADVDEYMSRGEVDALLGPAAGTTNMNFPDGHFMGPHEFLLGKLQPGQAYEEWKYTSGGEVYLIIFAGEEGMPANQWTVVGKTNFPQGAVF